MVGDQESGPDAHSLLASLREVVRTLRRDLDNAAQALAIVEGQLSVQDELKGRGRAPELNGRVDHFRWESDAQGVICWVEGAPRGQVVGHRIEPAGDKTGIVMARHVFADVPLELGGDGAAGGAWLLAGVPFFDQVSGRFLGHRGTARRADASGHEGDALASIPPDMVRQLVHEIRTPLNAIMGFADMINGEHLGPAEPAYRARAAEIAGQAGRMLQAVELLDQRAQVSTDAACQAARASAIGARPGEGL